MQLSREDFMGVVLNARGGIPMERRFSTIDAIHRHAPTIAEGREKFCFPETKKHDFCKFFKPL